MSEAYSWEWLPVNSLVVRGLFYSTEGLFAGTIICLTFSLIKLILQSEASIFFWSVMTIIILTLVARWWLGFLVVPDNSIEVLNSKPVRNWRNIRVQSKTYIATLIFAIPLVILVYYWPWYSNPIQLIVGICLILATSSYALGHFLCSEGFFDPNSMTLTYNESIDIPVNEIESINNFNLGGRSFLWLTFIPSSEVKRQVYVVPTEFARNLKESSGLDIDNGIGMRRISAIPRLDLVIFALLFGGIATALSGAIYLSEAPSGLEVVGLYFIFFAALIFLVVVLDI